jgi:multiple sugar transport system permease protein
VSAGAPANFAGTASASTARLPAAIAARRGRGPRGRVGLYKTAFFIAALLLISVLSIYPFIWLITASFKPQSQVFDNRLIPETVVWNYDRVFEIAPVGTWLWNTLWIGGLGALVVTFTSALVAFAFAYFRFPGRGVLFALILATMMLPPQVTMIPTYLIWNEFGLVNTQYPLWVPNLFGSAFYIFLQRQFFLGIPREYFEAARMDGDNYWTMFWRIAVPLAKPALIVTFIFEIQAKWFDLMTPLIYLRDSALFTLPLGIKTVLDQFGQGGGGEGEWQVIVAATVVLTLPMIVLFAIFQRYFIHGIATQGRKG